MPYPPGNERDDLLGRSRKRRRPARAGKRQSEVLAIDIPIGLTNLGVRDCDSIARKMLGSRACCVFTAPIRPVLHARRAGRRAASENASKARRSPPRLWGIVPKIREIDRLLSADRRFKRSFGRSIPKSASWRGTVEHRLQTGRSRPAAKRGARPWSRPILAVERSLGSAIAIRGRR